MNEVLKRVDAQLAATQRADDAAGHCLAHAKGVADSQHAVAHGDLVGVAQNDDGQLFQLDFENGQIGFWIGANHLGLGLAAVGQRDFNVVCTFHHMVVGEDVAILTNDDAATQTRLLLRALLAKEELEPRIVGARVPHRLTGIDADNGRRCLACSRREAAGRDFTCRGRWSLQQRNASIATDASALKPAGL